ncbi:MAG: RNA polymerase sigma factor [Chloroflexi bacterium]|nr:MAG: RNA polymerase sigma factor [Chloroflexota bacterium]
MSQSAHDPSIAPVLTDTVWFVEVVRDAQAGNLSAFDTLFQYYNARICTYLARMIDNDEEGRDLAQETFIKVWRALPGMNDVPQSIDHLRRRKFRWPLSKNHEADDTSRYMHMAGPEKQIEEAELIKMALAQVSPHYRACLLLQHVAGFTQREIAQSLNLSEKSISIYVGRGCEQFRQAYERLENGQDATRKRRSTP